MSAVKVVERHVESRVATRWEWRMLRRYRAGGIPESALLGPALATELRLVAIAWLRRNQAQLQAISAIARKYGIGG